MIIESGARHTALVDPNGGGRPAGTAARRRAGRIAARMVLAYVAAAGAWIAGSDALLARLDLGAGEAASVSMLKGFAFVSVTAGFLYWRMTESIGRLEEARLELAEAQERFRKAIVDAPIPVLIHAEGGEILLVNRTWTEVTGYAAEELRTISDWTARAYGDRREEVERIIGELFAIEDRVDEADFEVRIRDGSTRIWSFCSAPLGRLEDGRRMVISMARDVTGRRRAEDALRAGEARLRTLVESAPVGIVFASRGRFRYVNRAAVALFGVAGADALIGEPVLDWVHPGDREAVAGRIRILEAGRRPVGPREERFLRADGTELEAEVEAVPIRYEGEDGSLVFVRDIKARKEADRALAESTRRLRELSHRLLEVQEAERRHLSRELHDEIGQGLTAIKMSLEAARLRPEATRERLEDAAALLDLALEQVRGMARDLRPAILDDLGLVAALRWYVARFSGRSGIECRFRADPEEVAVGAGVATACFRVVQEALTNVARHAGATRVCVEVAWRASGLELVVADDGRGFEPGSAAGLGLVGMRERAELAGGRAEIRSVPGAGTEVRLRFPGCGRPDGGGGGDGGDPGPGR